MNERIRRIYVPMTESGFYILFCLQEPQHGYGIGLRVKKLTGGEVTIGAGTMYGTLSKMEKDGLIRFFAEEDKRRLYLITDAGREVLEAELKRIERLYKNSRGECTDE
ncbi:MAG: PadR family transcriptional regulator [Solobacterium sp.]|nr:PadR family transcriptional regulator [Solobacterium sp.]